MVLIIFIWQNKSKDLIDSIKTTLGKIQLLLLNTKIIWSQLLPRRKCRYIDDIEAMNTSVQRLNSAIAAELVKAGGGYIKYQEIIPNDESLFDSDGVTCLTKEMGSS